MITPDIIEIIGVVGGVLVLAAWALETVETVEKHKKLLDLKFSLISLVGTAMLSFYAEIEGFVVFFWLNLTITLVIIFEIWYSIHVKKIHKR